MSNTPIYDEVTNFKNAVKASTMFQAKNSIIKWIENEVAAGRIKATTDVGKIIKMIGELKWESTELLEVKLTGSSKGCTCSTSGTPSKSPRSSASSKKPAGTSKASSAKGKRNE